MATHKLMAVHSLFFCPSANLHNNTTKIKQLSFFNKVYFTAVHASHALIGLLQLAITWYKIGHAGGQAHYYSRNGTLKQRDLNQ